MSIIVRQKKKPRGRPRTGSDPKFTFRVPEDVMEQVDGWGAAQEPPLGRSEAIRELIKRGLKGNPLRDALLVGGVSSGSAKPLKRKR